VNEPARSPAKNPFSTRCARPGAIPFLFPEGVDLRTLIQRLRGNDWRGEIVGPHGSGKSALLATLIPAIEQAGKRVVLIELRDGQRRLPSPLGRMSGMDGAAVLVIDGYEQLSALSRFGAKRFCAARGVGLLATTHSPTGLPELHVMATDRDTAQRIVDHLLGGDWSQIGRQDVDATFIRHEGNLRETLFALYDLYESRRK
jgi:hypothetical protein